MSEGNGSDNGLRARLDASAQAILDSWSSALGAMGRQPGFGGWQNEVTGVGGPQDKRVYSNFFAADPTNTQENQELWRGDPMAKRIVETIPNEMLREGFEILIEGDVPNAKEIQKDVTAFWEDLGLSQALWTALCYERAYGGGAILIGANDTQTMNSPLNLKRISSFDWLTVVEPIELQAIRWQTDPQQRDFGLPAIYRLNPITPGGAKLYGVEVHNSRVCVFPGIRVSRRQVTTQAGWGDAILTNCRQPLRDFQMAHNAAAVLANDFSQSIFKMKGLSEIISMDKDKELVNRMRAMDLSRSIVRAVLIDADEEFERKSTPLTGLPDLLDRFSTLLAAAADMPLTLLMGQSPAGLNATGESDIRFFYDRVKAMQQRRLRPAIEQIVRVIMAVLKVPEPDSWSIKFKPLWQPTEAEIATARFTQSQTDEKYINLSVVSSEEVRRSRFGGDAYSFETQIDAQLTALATEPLGEEGAPKYPDLAPQTTAPPTDPTIPEESAYSNDPDKVVTTAQTPTGEDVESIEPSPNKIQVRPHFRARPTVRPTSDSVYTLMVAMRADDFGDDISRELSSDYPERALAWIKSIAWEGPVRVPIDDVDFSEADTWRASSEPEKVDRFAERIASGWEKPVMLVRRPGYAKLMIPDGHHRSLAYKKLGKPMLAFVGDAPTAVGPWDTFHSSQLPKDEKAQRRAAAVEKTDADDAEDLLDEHVDDLANDYVVRMDRIKRRGGKYYVTNEAGDKDLGGPYDTEEQAQRRLGQIEYFKTHKE